MSSSEPWTIRRLLDWTTDYLKRSGSTTPRLDAEVLLAHVQGCDRIHLYTAYNDETSEQTRQAFRDLVKRRAEGSPVAYLVGHREFFSLDFLVTPDVLIPRPETEYIVVSVLELAKEHKVADEPFSIVDMGTGSGILAICAAIYLPQATITAVDISEAALAVARKNAEKHHVADRIEFRHGDLFEACRSASPFQFIVSNPPYVAEVERDRIPRDVRDHEPSIAVFSGPDGSDVTRRLIGESPQHLRAGGWLIFEIAPNHEQMIRTLIEAGSVFESPAVVKDLAGLPRVVRARRIR